MKIKILLSTPSLLVVFATAAAANTLVVGDGQIDGHAIKPYEYSWHQCAVQEGEWSDQGDLTESLVVIGNNTLRQQQVSVQPDGVTATVTTYFDRASMAPLRMELKATAGDGTTLISAERELTPDGYSGWVARGGDVTDVQGVISSKMLHGGALGLPLATLDYQDSILEFAASMMSFDATYKVKAEWVGKESIEFEDQKIETWLVDLEWHHEGQGDIYPPGPDASGGRFWVVPNPPDGFPYVPKYKTDGYAIEFISETCPVSTDG